MKSKNFLWASCLMIGLASCGGSDDIPETPDTPDVPGGDVEKPLGKEMDIATFETYNQTPYFFRFGNKGGKAIDLTYKPRWVYSHQVVKNPVKGTANNSEYVLQYTSMEAQNYGLKIRFNSPIAVKEIGNVQVKIYQPKNVIGKETFKNMAKATKQQVCVKLLSEFHPINDYGQENGVLLTKDVKDFTQENEWVTFTFNFSKEDYPVGYSSLAKGVVGLAIMPTFKSNTTLAETGVYSCYIDEVKINGR